MITQLGNNIVAVFFHDGRKFLVAGCRLEEAEKYGQFLNYPESHFDVWNRFFSAGHKGKEYDYYPRGRVIYRKEDDSYLIYCDHCIKERVYKEVLPLYPKERTQLLYDFHYQCFNCNPDYIQLNWSEEY